MLPFSSSRLPFGLNLWIAARLLPQVMKYRQLDDILRRATPEKSDRAYDNLEAAAIVEAVKKSVSRPWRMRGRRCLREGLLAFHYLKLAGYAPVLHFGLVPKTITTNRPQAHCWISLNGATILNPPAVPMLDLFAYDGVDSMPANGTAQLAGAIHD